jgi:hypothetical protein
MDTMKRWVALAADGELLALGTTPYGKFDRTCLKHSCGSYMKWVAEGARYCELHCSFKGMTQGAVPHPGIYIHNLPHGRIRACQSARPIL